MKTDASILIRASRVMPGDDIDVLLSSLDPTVGSVQCRVHERSTRGWLVSHFGSSLMPVKWSFDRKAWVFDVSRIVCNERN